ncbi:uncharacterized protein [Littorina saxatilis]|uniref:Uncharacterized protein n=2 Tax=Littorina saxatilis TaxID=31220 RepID=A0AAN9BVW4_9CAEN
MGQYYVLVLVLFLLLASLALTIVALLTDNWYRVHTPDNVNPEAKKKYNFHFGLWRLCYEDMPEAIANDESYDKEGSSCIFIHKALIQKDEESMDYDSKLRLHLSRTVLGCNIAAAAVMLFSMIALMCGVWPAKCDNVKKPGLFLSVSILLLFATLCGIASGVCFIAVRDLDNTTVRTKAVLPPAVPLYASQMFDWSFMLHWIGTGLAFVDSFLLLCLLKNSYDLVNEGPAKFTPYTNL